mgnify:FL=1|jgi:hypothetical protein
MNIKNIFGNWINEIEDLSKKYNNEEFPHIIIENFLNNDLVEEVYKKYPTLDNNWYVYNNPIEVKFSNNKLEIFDPVIQDIFKALSTDEMIEKISKITNIDNLESDPILHGAGLHMHPKNGRLMMHLDYEKHPIIENKQRCVNIILYLSKNWNPKWKGSTELWNKDLTVKLKESDVIFNNALIFQTNENSWHGIPDKIDCPSDVLRKTLAFYYISPLTNKASLNKKGSNSSGFREKAIFSLRPNEYRDKKILKLLDIRPYRRITEKDMEEIYPEWNNYV